MLPFGHAEPSRVRDRFAGEDLFGDDAGWDALRAEIAEGSEEGFFANVEYVDDRRFEGLSAEALEAAQPHRDDGWDVMYVADERAIKEPVHPLLLVRVGSSEDCPFRCRARSAV